MALVGVNRNPSDRELGWFELLLYLFLLGIGALCYWRQQVWLAALLAVVPLFLFGAFRASRRARRVVYLGWCYLTLPIGLVTGHLLLLSLFMLVITPIGLFRRLAGRSGITRRPDPDAKSYWQPIQSSDDIDRYFKQF